MAEIFDLIKLLVRAGTLVMWHKAGLEKDAESYNIYTHGGDRGVHVAEACHSL